LLPGCHGHGSVGEGGSSGRVYDPTTNAGWVSVGITHDTAEFAVQSIRTWLDRIGLEEKPSLAADADEVRLGFRHRPRQIECDGRHVVCDRDGSRPQVSCG
jgi:hypothetical protein